MMLSTIPKKRSLEPVRLSASIYQCMKSEILTGAIKPGESLLELQLAKRFDCSQSPVREACLHLSNEGLLKASPYKGYTVTEITIKEIKELYQLRLIIECAVVEMAAQNASAFPDVLAEMEHTVEVHRRGFDSTTLVEFIDAEVCFHVAIARMSDNGRLLKIVMESFGHFQRFYYKILPLQGARSYDEVSTAEHAEILDQIRKQNCSGVRNLMHDHIIRGREHALELYFGS